MTLYEFVADSSMNNAGETKYNKEMIKLTKYFEQRYTLIRQQNVNRVVIVKKLQQIKKENSMVLIVCYLILLGRIIK